MYVLSITGGWAVVESCCNSSFFVNCLPLVFHSVLDLVAAQEHFTDHHPRTVSRANITCVVLEPWFALKHQIPYRRYVGWHCKQNTPVRFGGWKASRLWCRFMSLFVGFLSPGKDYNTFAYTWCFPSWIPDVEAGMAKGDQCCKGGEEEASAPTFGMQWRAKQWCHAGRWRSGTTQALENGLLGWELSWQLLPTDLLRNQRFGVRQH